MKEKIIIGIDPDLHKSGIAIKEGKNYIKIESLTMWDLFILLRTIDITMIYLEYSNNNSTWHRGGRGASINVGKNKAVAIIIKEFCEAHKLPLTLCEPTGYSKLFDISETFKQNTGWVKATNKDGRAAAAIIFGR